MRDVMDTQRERAKRFAYCVFMLADWARTFTTSPTSYNHERLVEAALDLAAAARTMTRERGGRR